MKKLPQDAVIFMLLKLPLNSLLRFKSVSKFWYTLILSETFFKLHLKCTTPKKDEFILFIRTLREDDPDKFTSIASFFSVDDKNNLTTLFPDVDVTHLTSTSCTIFNELIGPCHGLITLTDSDIIIVLNPGTRKYVVIPERPFECPKGYYRYIEAVAFGFDSIVNDYKIIKLSDVYWDPPTDDRGPRGSRVEIYNLSIDSWREHNIEFSSIYFTHCSEIYYKEAVHWFTIQDDLVILCFDISSEIFRTMELPSVCTDLNGPRYGLAVLNDSLVLMSYPDSMCSIGHTENLLNIWMMKEYGESESWISIRTISPLPIPIESALVIWKDYLLLPQTQTGYLISYDLNSDEVKEFNLNGHRESLRAIKYIESNPKATARRIPVHI
uniref:Self-incompatibility S-locus F-box protein n=2 Tax=Solanum lycopersicoides TaxID=142760 RepID=A0A060ILN1_9SOLN|nr:self-incompatibility S-locus F-box protein [Solanum lycopersicoides]